MKYPNTNELISKHKEYIMFRTEILIPAEEELINNYLNIDIMTFYEKHKNVLIQYYNYFAEFFNPLLNILEKKLELLDSKKFKNFISPNDVLMALVDLDWAYIDVYTADYPTLPTFKKFDLNSAWNGINAYKDNAEAFEKYVYKHNLYLITHNNDLFIVDKLEYLCKYAYVWCKYKYYNYINR